MAKVSLKEQVLKDKALLVNKAMEAGKTTRSEICDATGMSLTELGDFFKYDRDTFAKWQVYRRSIKDLAADNIVTIIKDKTHPKHYDASKYILQNYKSDLDDVLESGDGIIEIDGNSPKAKSSVKIVFSRED